MAGGDEDSGPTRAALADFLSLRWPSCRIEDLKVFGVDDDQDAADHKAIGYGRPVRVYLTDCDGIRHAAVFHFATSNAFGHDRRADRARDMILAFDTFGDIPKHTKALELGAVDRAGRLVRLSELGEFFVLTTYAKGLPYAEDLREVGRRGEAGSRDIRRAAQLGSYLAALHVKVERPGAYTRAFRDLVGSGEGIFGLADSYPEDDRIAPTARLLALEQACLKERHRWHRHDGRLCRTHGDFHPFNILFDEADELSVLDTSRGSLGEPADDLIALSVNYLFFGLEYPDAWQGGFRLLWQAFWDGYATRSDAELLRVAPAFLAWRTLVLCSPRWYPDVPPDVRDSLLCIAEESLAKGCVDHGCIDRHMVGGRTGDRVRSR